VKKELTYIFCLLFLFVPSSIFGQEYSLDDLYGIALDRSGSIKIAEEDLYISEREKDRATSVLMPRLSAYGGYMQYSEEKRSAGALIQPDHSSNWGLRLDQSFSLSGRELTAFRIAKQGITRSGYDLYAEKEEYLLGIASGYYDVLKANKALEISGANVERLTRHRDAAKKRLDVGEATRTDLLRAEAELAGAQSVMIRSENFLRLAKAALAKRAGISGAYELKEPGAGPGVSGPDRHVEALNELTGECKTSAAGCLKEKALAERAEIRTMTVRREIAEDEVKYYRGAYWPSLSVEGVYNRQDSDPSRSTEIEESVYGGVKLNFPFFEGGLRTAEVRQAKARLRQAEYALSDLRDAVNLEVETSYLDLITVSAVLNKLKAETEYALDNYNAVTKQFQYGLADSIDVIDANTLLVTAQQGLANAGYDYDMSLLKLKRAAGILLKTIIGPGKTAGEKNTIIDSAPSQ